MVAVVVGAAVFLHADRHGSRHPTAWAILTFLAPIIALVYMGHVYRIRRRRRF